MKKASLLFTVLSGMFLSCSTDEPGDQNFSITVQQTCPGIATAQEYCVTEEVKTSVLESISTGDPCVWVSFKDIQGNNRSGYFRNGGTAGEGVCN